MLNRVFVDLVGFGILFTVLIFQIGLIIAVVGIENQYMPGEYQDEWLDKMSKPYRMEMMTGEEYIHLGGLTQHIFQVVRLSFGDFEFGAVQHLPSSC